MRGEEVGGVATEPEWVQVAVLSRGINKVTTLGDVSKMVHFGQGFEKLRSSNYFWIDSDAAAPGDFHWQYQNFNTVRADVEASHRR